MMLTRFPLAVRLFLSAATVITFSGCETTGDPRAGGIFWSETKARQRIAAKQSERLQAKREAVSEHAKLARLESEIKSLRREIAKVRRARKALQADPIRVEHQRTDLSTNGSLEISEKERQLADLLAEVSRLKERNKLLRASR